MFSANKITGMTVVLSETLKEIISDQDKYVALPGNCRTELLIPDSRTSTHTACSTRLKPTQGSGSTSHW